MSHLLKTLLFFIISSSLVSCEPWQSHKPNFKDGGATLANLKREYHCESLEFENWRREDVNDSTLTVCLINSKLAASLQAKKIELQVEQLKQIARRIRSVVEKPSRYKSYYIIFVQKEGTFPFETKVHSLGMDIANEDL